MAVIGNGDRIFFGFCFVLCSLNRNFDLWSNLLLLDNKKKNKFYFVLCSPNRNFDLWSNLLLLDNKKKNKFYFVLCSLNRNFVA